MKMHVYIEECASTLPVSNFTALKWTATGLSINVAYQSKSKLLVNPLLALLNQRIDKISHKLSKSNCKRGYEI